MSIISVYEADKSDSMYKRFASLAVSYLDKPDIAKNSAAHIPLENLFRLLEMYRYNAFSDESRGGVLAVEATNDHIALSPEENYWHTNIENALNTATSEAFEQSSKEEAIENLEETLRLLSTNNKVEAENVARTKVFFNAFIKGLE